MIHHCKEFIIAFGFEFFLLIIIIGLLAGALKSKTQWLKKTGIYVSSVLIAILLYEVILGFMSPTPLKTTGPYFEQKEFHSTLDTIHGYSLANKTFSAKANKFLGDSLLYSILYDVKDGVRITPSSSDTTAENIIVFLGGSFTYGEGVENNETLPHYLGEITDSTWMILNKGFSGYGTHQALSILEHDLLTDTSFTSKKQKKIVYSFIPDHYKRAAGFAFWDKNGPLYELENGSIVKKGAFSRHKNTIEKSYVFHIISKIWRATSIYKVNFYNNHRVIDDVHHQRVYGIIKKMNQLSKDNNIQFYVLIDAYYAKQHPTYESIQKVLQENQVPFLLGAQCIPDIENKKNQYYIPYDQHPRPIYHEEIARCLYSLIFQ